MLPRKTWVSVLIWLCIYMHVCMYIHSLLLQCTCGFLPPFHFSHFFSVSGYVFLCLHLSFCVLAFVSLSPSPSFLFLFLYHILSLHVSLCLCHSMYNQPHVNPKYSVYLLLFIVHMEQFDAPYPNLRCKGTECSIAPHKSLFYFISPFPWPFI